MEQEKQNNELMQLAEELARKSHCYSKQCKCDVCQLNRDAARNKKAEQKETRKCIIL